MNIEGRLLKLLKLIILTKHKSLKVVYPL